jgi:hypothetical protein
LFMCVCVCVCVCVCTYPYLANSSARCLHGRFRLQCCDNLPVSDMLSYGQLSGV